MKPRIDTGLGLKKSGSGTRIPDTLSAGSRIPDSVSGWTGQKRSEPNLPKHRKYSGAFKESESFGKVFKDIIQLFFTPVYCLKNQIT